MVSPFMLTGPEDSEPYVKLAVFGCGFVCRCRQSCEFVARCWNRRRIRLLGQGGGFVKIGAVSIFMDAPLPQKTRRLSCIDKATNSQDWRQFGEATENGFTGLLPRLTRLFGVGVRAAMLSAAMSGRAANA